MSFGNRPTLIASDEPIQCSVCPTVYVGSVDSARKAKWRVGWTPGSPCFCPQCWNQPKAAIPAATFTDIELPFEQE